MKNKTNFDRYLEEQLKDPEFAERFQKAGEAWDVALQIFSFVFYSPQSHGLRPVGG